MKFSELVNESGHSLEHVKHYTVEENEHRKDKIKQSPNTLMFCENITKEEAIIGVSEKGMSFEYLPESIVNDEIKLAALANEPLSFSLMRNNSDTVINKAVELDGDNLVYLSTEEKTKDRCITAVRKTPSAIRFCNPAVFDDEE